MNVYVIFFFDLCTLDKIVFDYENRMPIIMDYEKEDELRDNSNLYRRDDSFDVAKNTV